MCNHPQPKTPQIFVTLQPNPQWMNVYDAQTTLVQVLALVMLLKTSSQPEAWRIAPLQQEDEISFVLLPLPNELISPEDAWQLVNLLRQQPEILEAILLLHNAR